MSKFTTALEIYRQGGISELFRRAFLYALVYSSLAPSLKSLLGARYHQKAYMYLNLCYWPQIREPRTFNEHIMHRKLYTDEDLFSTVEDKWAVREYVTDRVGVDVLNEVYHMTDDPETIPFEDLPDEYVIKPTHLSGPVEIVDDPKSRDVDRIKDECRHWLERSHETVYGEYWYDDIEPRILVEERLHDDDHTVPLDFKMYVFDGRVEYIHVDFDRFSEPKRRFFDRDWNPQEFTKDKPIGPEIDEPERLEEMIKVAERLGEDFDFIRVDLYQPKGERVVFGEMTVAPASGRTGFSPRSYDFEFGSLWSRVRSS